MRASGPIFSLLAVLAISLATWLEPWFQNWAGSRAASANLLHVALGDSRRLFARHFYVKADAYLHRGYYQTIFDRRDDPAETHLGHHATEAQEHDDDQASWLGPPKDWIDRFSRHFYPSRHLHLGEDPSAVGPEAHEEHADHEHEAHGEDRELLPWLRLSASLDPDRAETYLVAAFWLRTRLGKVNEAEQFLREGLRHVPGDPELLFELGRIALEDRKDTARARNVWELALRHWQTQSASQTTPDKFVGARILGQLAKLEEQAGNYSRTIEHLQGLLALTPYHAAVEKWLEEVKRKAAGP